MILNNPLISKFLSLNLPKEDYALFGSAIMYFHGLKDLGNLDVVARGKAWEKACRIKEPEIPPSKKGLVVRPFGDEIEIFSEWSPGDWDVNDLIDGAETIEGIKVVGFDNVIKAKKLRGSEKDFVHIKMMEEYLNHQVV